MEAKAKVASAEASAAELHLNTSCLQVRLTEELALAEAAHAVEADEMGSCHSEALAVARARRDHALGRLSALRQALQAQHAAAEAEHEEAIGGEVEAEHKLAM